MSDDFAVNIESHPGTLSDEELGVLQITALKMRSLSERFGLWLASRVEFEIARRRALEVAEFIEPELPALKALDWSDAELGNALTASFIALTTVCRDREPNASKLLEKTHFALLAYARQRLGSTRTPNEKD